MLRGDTESIGVVSVPIGDELTRLVEGLSKVYSDKNPEISIGINGLAAFINSGSGVYILYFLYKILLALLDPAYH